MTANPHATKLSIGELHELVWTQTLKKLAVELKITTANLVELCKIHNIPRPPQGYWQRHARGKTEPVVPLPATVIATTYVSITSTTKNKQNFSRKTLERLAYESEHPIQVAAKLVKPHKLVDATRTGFAQPHTLVQHALLLAPSGSRVLDVHVSRASVPRALRIWEALLRAAGNRALSIQVECESQYRCKTLLTIDGYRFELSMREKQKQLPQLADQNEHRRRLEKPPVNLLPTGLLYLSIKRQNWGWPAKQYREDGKGKLLEASLNGFFEEVYKVVDALEERLSDERRRDSERRQETDRQGLVRREAALEAEKVQQLRNLVEDWHTSKRIREFAQDVRERTNLPEAELEDKISWILLQADKLDPLSAVE